MGLRGVRAVLLLKAGVWGIAGVVGLGLRPVGRVIVRGVAVPIYGLLFRVRRLTGSWYLPAKRRLLFFVANRFVPHAAVVVLGVVVVVSNMRFPVVRAESLSFGERSLLYAAVTHRAVEITVESAETESTLPVGTRYLADSALRPSLPSPTNFANTVAGVTSPTTLPPAQRTTVIAYTVEPGDTLSTISERFDITLNTLLWANNLTVRSLIRPGQELTILPVSGVQHTIARGDTLSTIARRYSVTDQEIRVFNGITDDTTLAVGKPLIIPGGERPAPTPAPRAVAVRTIFTTPPAGAGSSARAPGAAMTWPTDLHVHVRGLSWYHTGVDIDCNGHANGTSTNDNYAAADGIVRYAGWRKGYGNTVEIDHGNGLVTRYGHFYSLYVSTGEAVSTGQALGRCGSTGNSSGTHLHFEVIANGKFMNPYDYLR